MPESEMTAEALVATFEAKAAAPPPESSQMLVRYLQCKESLAVSRSITEAMDRHSGNDGRVLAVPTELLPPLG